jgi:hypothetical protein
MMECAEIEFEIDLNIVNQTMERYGIIRSIERWRHNTIRATPATIESGAARARKKTQEPDFN